MNKQDVNSKLLIKKENIKIIKADIMEDKEEYFVTKDIIIQEIQNIKPRFKDKTNIIPRKVATPLPPLNLSHTGNI